MVVRMIGKQKSKKFRKISLKAVLLGLIMIMFINLSKASNTYLISDVNKDKAHEGDIIKIYGYVYDNYKKENLEVKIFLNNKLYSVVKTNKEGYFEQYIKMEELGVNLIEVIYKNEINKHKILVYKKEPEIKIMDPTYYSKIILVGDNIATVYPYHYKEEVIKNQYVDVELSTKELSISKFGGSVLKVKIYNHLNKTTTFSASIEGLEDKDYYTSGTLELKPLERGEISIYINPLETFEDKEITLRIKEGNKTIAEKKLRIEIVNKKNTLREIKRENLFDLSSKEIISLVLVFMGAFMIMYAIYKYDGEEKGILIENQHL